MSHPKPFQFGVQSFHAESAAQWRDRARRAEELGYYALTLADHFLGPGPALESTLHPLQTLAPVPAMAVAAEATSRLRIGSPIPGGLQPATKPARRWRISSTVAGGT